MECLIGCTCLCDLVLRIGTSAFGADDRGAKHAGKAARGFILPQDPLALLRIGLEQVLVAAEDRDRQAFLCKEILEILGPLVGEPEDIGIPALAEELRGKVDAFEAKLSCVMDLLFERVSRHIVEPHTRDNPARHDSFFPLMPGV